MDRRGNWGGPDFYYHQPAFCLVAYAAETGVTARGYAEADRALHEDDIALAAFISQANSALAKMPAPAGSEKKSSLQTYPVFLLMGPEGSGKTSIFLNSGVEPELLAGQEGGPLLPSSTRLCNIWLARSAVFIEFAGKTFTGDLERWRTLLKVLNGDAQPPAWKRLWLQPRPGIALRGVIAFSDVKDLVAASTDPQRLDRNCREWEQRLRAVAEVFGVPVPVYQVFSKCDGISFFSEFFRRLPETEANQVLGCTLAINLGHPTKTAELAEVEAKRLTNSFRQLYQALARRRLSLLAREPERNLRPAIYEFPRELKRIRTSLVQFLTEVFRPNALRFGPILRGYYFSARKADEAAAGYSQVQLDASETSLDASHVFHGDATRMFKPEEAAPGFSPSGRRSGTFRWMFVSDLFHEVILRDAFPRQQARSDPRTERYRKVAFASLCGICLILSLIFVQSWWQNRNLIHNVERLGTAPTSRRGAQATLTDLRALDALRADLKELRNGGRISSHWGLYAGNRVLDAARRAYFQKFQSSLLNSANARMVQTLASAPESGQPASVHDLLKTHLMISSGRCKAEPQFVSKVLKAEARPADQDDPSLEWQTLANRQIDFYASELEYGNPCQIAEDRAACDHARKYILQSAGVEGIYRVILADAEKNVPKPSRLQDIASNYAQVLTGPADVSAAFTLEGWKFVEKASKDHGASALEPCIGEGASGSSDPRAIQQMFIRDYVDHWHKYLAGFSVIRYNGPKDAARKLDILSDHKSPLLALFSLIANQTNFPITPESNVLEKVPILGSFVKKGEKAVNKAQEFRRESPVTLTTADITRAFQPVSWVVPTTNDVLVFEKNNAYVDALAQLGHSMQDIEGKGADPGAIGATSQNAEKASEAVRQIAKGFKTLQVEGVDADVQRLLEEPIQNAKGLIPQDPGIGLVSRINGDAKALCLGLRGTLQKFPFQVTSNNDVSLTEFAGVFTPGTGSIWKFVQKSLSELIVKEGSTWKVKDPSKNPVPTPEFVDFLNRAQTVSDVFFRAGATQPQLTYILRPRPDSAPKNSTLELDVDGQSHRWTTSLQKQFSWPAAAGSTAGAVGRIRTDSLVYPFASRSGPWGIFRVLDDAEPRPVSGKLLEWKYARGSNGNPEPIEPPVRLDIVEFPGGVDVFNPKFLQQLKCPMTAVQAAPK